MSEQGVARPLRAQRRPLDVAHLVLLACSLVLAAVTWWAAGGGVYTAPLVTCWLLALAVWIAAWWPGRGETGSPGVRESGRPGDSRGLRDRAFGWTTRNSQRETRNLLVVALIVAVGAFFRFYRLAEVPHDPTSDHAEKLLDVLDLVNGMRPIFFSRNTGREPAQFYWTLLLIRGFGFPLSWQTLKWGTALIGLAAVPAIYLVGRRLGGNTAGLVAAALFAVSKWPVNISRMGLRFPLAILPTALVVWLLLRYVRRPDRRDALLCGLAIGAGLHGYISFRIVPLLVPLFLGLALLMDARVRRMWRAVLGDGALIAATALLACLPLARYSVDYPDQVWFRVNTRIGDTERSAGTAAEELTTFVDNNRRALLAFNVRGDATRVNAVSYDPFLDPVTGVAFVAGALIAAVLAVRRRDVRCAALLLALPILLLPSTLSISFPIENPSANRMGLAAAVVFPLAALPVALLLRRPWRPVLRVGLAVALALLFAFAVRHNFLRYFRDYDLQYRASIANSGTIAATIRERVAQGVPLDNVFVLAYPYWLDGRNIAFELGDIGWKQQHDIPENASLPRPTSTSPLLFVLNSGDAVRLEQLRLAYPDGVHEVVTPPGEQAFQLYTVR